jgi:hypothetical protein
MRVFSFYFVEYFNPPGIKGFGFTLPDGHKTEEWPGKTVADEWK